MLLLLHHRVIDNAIDARCPRRRQDQCRVVEILCTTPFSDWICEMHGFETRDSKGAHRKLSLLGVESSNVQQVDRSA